MGSPIEKEHDPSHQSQSQAVSAVLLGFRDESLLQLFPHRRAMIKRLGNSLPKLRDQGALIPIGEEVPLFGSQSGIIGTEDLPKGYTKAEFTPSPFLEKRAPKESPV